MKTTNYVKLRKGFLIVLFFGVSFYAFGQDTNKEKTIILINDDYEKKLKEVDDANKKLQSQLEELKKRKEDDIKTLEEKIALITGIQEKAKRKELLTYQKNYSVVVINLLWMDKEFKPIQLFNSSRDFFGSIDASANPMSYTGYKDWFNKYKEYIKKQSENSVIFESISNVIGVVGDLTKGTPFTGTIASTIIGGIDDFIQNTTKKGKLERTEAMKMMKLTTLLSQFTHEKDLVNDNWKDIDKELEELKKLQETFKEECLANLGKTPTEFNKNFVNNNIASQYNEYINSLAAISRQKVEENSKKEGWKNDIYRQMTKLQSLMRRFGEINLSILNNIEAYRPLIAKYKEVSELSSNFTALELSLDKLKEAFSNTFNPLKYLESIDELFDID